MEKIMEPQINNTTTVTVKAKAIKENREMTKEEIAVHLDKIQENTTKLEVLAQRTNEIEQKLNVNP